MKYNKDLLKPFVKWAGGKRQLRNDIYNNLPNDFNRYFEPFVGGGAIFFELLTPSSTINDYNIELINTYEVIRDDVDSLIGILKEHKENNSKEYYLKIREMDRRDDFSKQNKVVKAARFIYMNKTGFNGLYRVNSKNQFNVPYGRYKNPNIVNEQSLREISKFLSNENIKILNGDFEHAVINAKKDDFIYFDPPYAPLTDEGNNFVSYTDKGFNHEEQVRLRDLFIELDKKGCYVMLSNSSTPLIHDLYKDYKENIQIVGAKRSINSKGSGRGKVDEVLITNYKVNS